MWYEVFRNATGRPLWTVPSRRLARLLAWWYGLDFAPVGDGWLE